MVNNKGLLRSQNCLSITLQVKCKVSANLSLLELCRTVAFTRNCNLYYNCKVTKNNRDDQIFAYYSLVIQKQFGKHGDWLLILDQDGSPIKNRKLRVKEKDRGTYISWSPHRTINATSQSNCRKDQYRHHSGVWANDRWSRIMHDMRTIMPEIV